MANDIESKLYNRRIRMREVQSKRLAVLEPVQELVPGTVFSIGGSIFADRGSRYVWVHEWGALASQQQAYLPYHIGVFDGAGVIMQRAPKAPYQYEIIRLNTSPYPGATSEGSDIERAAMKDHGENHQFPTENTKGPDPTLVWHAALQILKSVADGSNMNVVIGPTVYYSSTARLWFPSQTISLTAFIPSSGNAVRVLIYLSTFTGTIGIISSAEVVIPGSPAFPNPPPNSIPSAYFYLEDTYTTLDMTSDYADARQFLGTSSAAVAAPSAPSQQIFSNNSLEWVLGKTVTSNGEVVVSGGDIVWSST